ncbi:MAG: hypothetical protein SGILL_006456, partial [Bacillariaceae sp.]
AKYRLFSGQQIPKSLWPTILSKSHRAFRGDMQRDERGRTSRTSSPFARQEEINILLQKRAANELFQVNGGAS